MAREFDVTGDLDGDDVVGYDVMGDLDGDDVVGEDVVGVVKRNRQTGRAKIVRVAPKRNMMALPPKPAWRKDQMAPGVQRPDEGMVPLPLAAQGGTPLGTFSATVNQITFQGQLQKPFRPERLLVSTVRTGVTAIGRLLGVLYVGTDLQQAEIAGWDIELIGQAASFGTRLTCQAAEPGVLVRIVVNLSTPLTTTDTIFCAAMFLGRIIH
jgi:hypothetical protein